MIEGKNPTLLNVTYLRQRKNPEGEVIQEEAFEVIYKNDEGKVCRSIEKPEADIYIVKPEFRNYTYNKPEERIEHVDKIRVKISDIKYTIANNMGDPGKELIRRAHKEGNYRLLNQVYKWPYAYVCDFQPEYYFMKNWYEKYSLGNVKLTKSFIDIETDSIDYVPDLDRIQDTAYAPVNLVSVCLEETKEFVTFILRPYKPSRMGRSEQEYRERYSMYEEQMKQHVYLMSHQREFINDLHKTFDPMYGHMNYHIREYEREIDLIKDVFNFINVRKPNFALTWNMRFDIQYLYYRIEKLGERPAFIMCHEDFESNLRCSFKVDRSTFLLEKQFDYFYCSSYTQYICQMRLYASIRKSRHKLRSVKLNDIAQIELKDKKVEYPDEANITQFMYLSWMRFIKYNIKDVLLQVGIERKTNDVMAYYTKSHANLTPYNKIFRETHLLRNVREMYFERDGWVQGNNLNVLDEIMDESERRFYGKYEEDDEDESSFKGAINAEPTMNDNVGMKVLGEKTNNIHENAMDYDMGAFYPSIKIASNMDPITLLYKASFDNDEFISGEFINRSLNTKYTEKDKNGNVRRLDFTGEAVNTYASKNILTFGYNYMAMPSVSELYDIVKRELS